MVVVAYQPWLNSERRWLFRPPQTRRRHPRRRVTQYSVKLKILDGIDYWIPAFWRPRLWRFLTQRTGRLVLRGENAVAPGLQSDDVADLKFPVAGRIDLNHGLTAGRRQGDFGALDRAEGSDMPHRAVERAAAGRPDLHVMAADEQFRCARPSAVRRDIQRLAAKPHATVANLHRQHDRFPDEAVHERGGRIVIDLAGRADLL